MFSAFLEHFKTNFVLNLRLINKVVGSELYLCLVLLVEEAWACFHLTVSSGVPKFGLLVVSPHLRGCACVLCSEPWSQTHEWV